MDGIAIIQTLRKHRPLALDKPAHTVTIHERAQCNQYSEIVREFGYQLFPTNYENRGEFFAQCVAP